MGVARKRDVGGYSKLMDKAAKCLHRLFELAPSKKRNYILDQVKYYVYLIHIEDVLCFTCKFALIWSASANCFVGILHIQVQCV